MTDAELFSCKDTHHFIRGEVDETRQDEEITEPKTSDKEKLIRQDGKRDRHTAHAPLPLHE